MKTLATIIGAIVLIAITVLIFAVLLSLPVWALWNWVGIDVLGLHHITLLQAWGLLVLCGCLFKSSASVSKSSS